MAGYKKIRKMGMGEFEIKRKTVGIVKQGGVIDIVEI